MVAVAGRNVGVEEARAILIHAFHRAERPTQLVGSHEPKTLHRKVPSRMLAGRSARGLLNDVVRKIADALRRKWIVRHLQFAGAVTRHATLAQWARHRSEPVRQRADALRRPAARRALAAR